MKKLLPHWVGEFQVEDMPIDEFIRKISALSSLASQKQVTDVRINICEDNGDTWKMVVQVEGKRLETDEEELQRERWEAKWHAERVKSEKERLDAAAKERRLKYEELKREFEGGNVES